MQKKYVYSSIIFHIAIVLLCVIDISFLSGKREFDEQPPIIVDLNDVKISDMTNIPELAVRGEERKVATRKDEQNKEGIKSREAMSASEIRRADYENQA